MSLHKLISLSGDFPAGQVTSKTEQYIGAGPQQANQWTQNAGFQQSNSILKGELKSLAQFETEEAPADQDTSQSEQYPGYESQQSYSILKGELKSFAQFVTNQAIQTVYQGMNDVILNAVKNRVSTARNYFGTHISYVDWFLSRIDRKKLDEISNICDGIPILALRDQERAIYSDISKKASNMNLTITECIFRLGYLKEYGSTFKRKAIDLFVQKKLSEWWSDRCRDYEIKRISSDAPSKQAITEDGVLFDAQAIAALHNNGVKITW